MDLAAPVVLQNQVTLAARAILLTHFNVGYEDHPLKSRFSSETAGVTIFRASFIGSAGWRDVDWLRGILQCCRAGNRAVSLREKWSEVCRTNPA